MLWLSQTVALKGGCAHSIALPHACCTGGDIPSLWYMYFPLLFLPIFPLFLSNLINPVSSAVWHHFAFIYSKRIIWTLAWPPPPANHSWYRTTRLWNLSVHTWTIHTWNQHITFGGKGALQASYYFSGTPWRTSCFTTLCNSRFPCSNFSLLVLVVLLKPPSLMLSACGRNRIIKD